MLIGIDGSRAFLKQRTGIEEYSYQVIKHLRDELNDPRARLVPASPSLGGSTSGLRESRQIILYIKHDQKIDFDLPNTWRVKKLWSLRLWTQVRLSLELLLHPVNVLFVPAHTVPIIHPKNTIVAIHGLEYEFVPAAYSWWAKMYMALIIKNSCRWAKKIISVSKNTKQDLANLYKIPEEKVKVIHEGYDPDGKSQIPNPKSQIISKFKIQNSKFLLFIGRLEERKNVVGIIKSFGILKEKYHIPHKLFLAGKEGYGYANIELEIKNSKFKDDIVLPGYISQEEKWELLRNAEIFLFPTLYEGFGLPILEAQSVGVPVIASNTSSIPEIANGSALLAEPTEPEFIAKLAYDLISDAELRDSIIKKGYENVKRFSWSKCAREIAQLINMP